MLSDPEGAGCPLLITKIIYAEQLGAGRTRAGRGWGSHTRSAVPARSAFLGRLSTFPQGGGRCFTQARSGCLPARRRNLAATFLDRSFHQRREFRTAVG